jgi:hypothetical protein
VTGGEDESVAIQPFRISWVALERFAKKDSANVGGTEWQAEVAGGTLVDGIHGETTGFIGSLSEEGFVHDKGEMSQEYVNESKKRQKRPGARERFFTGWSVSFKKENESRHGMGISLVEHPFMTRSTFFTQLGWLTLGLSLPSCRIFLPPATRPLRTQRYGMTNGKAQELFILLPGRHSHPEEFARYGLVDLIQRHHPQAEIIVPDLHLGYYAARLMPQCLHEEIIQPARKKGQRVTLVGVSMGGLGALMTALIHPKEVQEVLLLSPFVGSDALMSEIRAAGGIRQWQPGEIVPKNKDEAMKKLWAEMQKNWLPHGGPPMPIKMITGRKDRLLASNRQLAEAFLTMDSFSEIEGGHDWQCWHQGLKIFLEK